jgi:hypothetical protein
VFFICLFVCFCCVCSDCVLFTVRCYLRCAVSIIGHLAVDSVH